ncbi:glycine betaine ABC transporter substrate-binding protein [Paracoccus seriniphilus]|uniref:Glycine betaine/proline transport system substrate-binding protein n=1 Tax=Paracoccus seriniphilus TaxID=184748 RepID=A0A239PUR6_9RHOB|nr:glycine betaine ABC transporter substrate-binding protein [Paracoccus seriniphilus]WCR15383.1 glycine/betaine ABC transporter substrate-binding protein [Paracoccus seriniphilus]SNT73868.1 glycine betaine/proline transport system substrate-binding protein [Paracoccus seriniphilus]
MTYLKAFTALAALSLATAASAQDTVKVGEPSWPGAKIMSRVIAQVIQTRLGGVTEYAPGANAVIFAAMDGGRGDIDVHPDVWLPNQASFTEEYVDQKDTVALSEGSYQGRSGFCVPTYMAEEHGMKSVYDLATPMAQELFDGDGDGKGEIWVGASGWASTNLNRVKVRDYGIETFLEPSTEDEAVFYARLKDAIDNREGVVFYCYAPHFVHALYDVTFIEEPEYDPAAYHMVQPDEDADWFAKSSISTGDQVKTVTVAYSKSLEQRNPAAAAFLGKIDMDADDLSQLTYQTVIKGQEVDEAVAVWLEENSDVVDGWLGLN